MANLTVVTSVRRIKDSSCLVVIGVLSAVWWFLRRSR